MAFGTGQFRVRVLPPWAAGPLVLLLVPVVLLFASFGFVAFVVNSLFPKTKPQFASQKSKLNNEDVIDVIPTHVERIEKSTPS